MLGCVTFTWTDESFKLNVPSGTAFKGGFYKKCGDPSDLWKDANKQWEQMRKN